MTTDQTSPGIGLAGLSSRSGVVDRIAHAAWCNRELCDVANPDLVVDEHIEGYPRADMSFGSIVDAGGQEI